MAGGRIRPNQAAGNASRHLGNSLEGKPCNVFKSDNKIRIVLPTDARIYYPDAMVACGPIDQFLIQPVSTRFFFGVVSSIAGYSF